MNNLKYKLQKIHLVNVQTENLVLSNCSVIKPGDQSALFYLKNNRDLNLIGECTANSKQLSFPNLDFSDIQTSIIANNNIIEIKEDDVKIEIPLSEPCKLNLDIGSAQVNIQSCYFVDKSIETLFVGPSRPQGDTEFPGKVTETVAACHQSDNLGNSTAFLASGRQQEVSQLCRPFEGYYV